MFLDLYSAGLVPNGQCVCVSLYFVPMEWNVMLRTLTEWQSGHVSSLTITGVRFQARNKYAFRSETDNAPSVMN